MRSIATILLFFLLSLSLSPSLPLYLLPKFFNPPLQDLYVFPLSHLISGFLYLPTNSYASRQDQPTEQLQDEANNN